MGRNWRPKYCCVCPSCGWEGKRATVSKPCPKCGRAVEKKEMMTVIPRATHPDHPVVGHYFTSCGTAYYCDSYDPAIGYWMTNIHAIQDRRNVSERAIGRTYHEVYAFEDARRARLGITDATAGTIEQQFRESEQGKDHA